MNREDSAKVGGWLDHAAKMARTVAEHNAEETIAALTAERDNALAALRRRSSQRDQLDARCEQLFIEREQLRAAISSVRALASEFNAADCDGCNAGDIVRDILAALDSTDPVEAAPEELTVSRLLAAMEAEADAKLRYARSAEESEPGRHAEVVRHWEGIGRWLARWSRRSAALDGTHPDVPAPGSGGEGFAIGDWVLVDVGDVVQQRGQIVNVVPAEGGGVWEYDVRVRDGEVISSQPKRVHTDYTRSDAGLPADGRTE